MKTKLFGLPSLGLLCWFPDALVYTSMIILKYQVSHLIKLGPSCFTSSSKLVSFRKLDCETLGFFDADAGAERDHDRVDVRPREFRSETSAAENLAAYHCGPKFSGNCRRKGAYACHLCPYTSYSRGDVIKHVRVHTGERPFKCTICPYASTQRQNVTVHMRKHSKEKLFSCYICGSTYKLQQDLQRHLERCTNNMQ